MDKPQVHVPVEGTLVDWFNQVQVNPVTGQCFNFEGHLLEFIPSAEPVTEAEEVPVIDSTETGEPIGRGTATKKKGGR